MTWSKHFLAPSQYQPGRSLTCQCPASFSRAQISVCSAGNPRSLYTNRSSSPLSISIDQHPAPGTVAPSPAIAISRVSRASDDDLLRVMSDGSFDLITILRFETSRLPARVRLDTGAARQQDIKFGSGAGLGGWPWCRTSVSNVLAAAWP